MNSIKKYSPVNCNKLAYKIHNSLSVIVFFLKTAFQATPTILQIHAATNVTLQHYLQNHQLCPDATFVNKLTTACTLSKLK